MEVSVVHLTDRLMERQLDSVAAAYLAEDLEAQGINILLEKETVEITGNGRVEGLRFKDGDTLDDIDMVVMAIGITPNKELAEASGIYCEKGIVVSDIMQTYDPAIYAIGECVQNRGETFGLVAQVFDHGRVLSNHLAGDGRLAFKNRPVSMRLKVPGIDLYSGGKISDDEKVETITYKDDGARSYKKLYLRENRIEGVLLYGDIVDGPRLFQHLLDSDDISERRREILYGETRGNAGVSITSMPDETIVCGCNGVTKGDIKEAIKAKGLFSLADVTRETKAGGSCGGCSGVVERILESVLGTNFETNEEKNICPCTKYTREDIIKNIREKELHTVGEVMETLGWETVGCEECRPAINYYVQMLWPIESSDDPTSRLINERMHANQQKDGSFSVVPRIYGGVTTPEDLKKIAEVAINNSVPLVKITGGQRIDLLGIEQEKLPAVWSELGMPSGFAYAKAVRTVKTCVGEKFCRFGTQDSMAVGIKLEKFLEGLWMPAKVKLAVSGCPRNCAESSIKDVGIVGVKGGFNIYVGGNGGTNLRGADKLCTVESEEEVGAITGAFLQFYREEAEYAERCSKWVERVGLKTIKNAILEDPENRKALNTRLKIALMTVTEPWGERTSKEEVSARKAL